MIPSPKFYLFKQKDQHRIQVSISSGKRIREYTDLYISEKWWDKKRQRCRPLNTTCTDTNKELQRIEDRCIELNPDEWTKQLLKAIILDEEDEQIELTFFDVFEEYLEYGRKTKSEETVTKWKTVRKHLLGFQESLSEPLTFHQLDQSIYDELIYYLNSKELANNTIGRLIRFIKSFLQWAIDRKYHNNHDFVKWKGFSEEADLTFMTEEELFHFYQYPFERGTPLYNVRENHCFRCFTGMRFSDTREMDISEIDIEKKLVRKTIYKTGDRNHIFPLSKYALDILKRNDLDLHVYNSSKENELLKEAAKVAGLDRSVKRMIRRGSNRDITIKPLHEVIATHMGKRTFITLSLMRGVPERVILKIVGNKDYKSIEPYIKIVDQHSFEWIEKSWG
jgi:site-specific recombinase XerD